MLPEDLYPLPWNTNNEKKDLGLKEPYADMWLEKFDGKWLFAASSDSWNVTTCNPKELHEALGKILKELDFNES